HSPLIQVNPTPVRLGGAPSIPLSFSPAAVLPRWMTYRFRLDAYCISQTSRHHRLGRGLPGSLILFDPHAFVHQRQLCSRKLPSQSGFWDISMHFTTTCPVPPPSITFKHFSIKGTATVEPLYFTPDLKCRLRTL